MKKLLLLIILCSICGCSSVYTVPLIPEPKIWKNYNIDDVYKAATGDVIIKLENIKLWKTYTPVFEYQPPNSWVNTSRKLLPGQKWIAARVCGDGGVVLVNGEYSGVIGIHVMPDMKVGRGWIDTTGVVMRQKGWTKEPLFRQIDGTPERGSFACELVYSGISGDTIHLLYREFNDDLARPAFYQDLMYDIKESNLIMFKTLEIEILEAKNSYIKYKITSDGNTPWIPKQ